MHSHTAAISDVQISLVIRWHPMTHSKSYLVQFTCNSQVLLLGRASWNVLDFLQPLEVQNSCAYLHCTYNSNVQIHVVHCNHSLINHQNLDHCLYLERSHISGHNAYESDPTCSFSSAKWGAVTKMWPVLPFVLAIKMMEGKSLIVRLFPWSFSLSRASICQ